MSILNIFYQEPDPDRWFRYDRYPRKLIRTIIRGKSRPGGVMMFALQLMKGLDKINIQYRLNDFKHAKKHPEELVCLIGKPQLLFDRKWENPILFGPGTYSHPIDCPDLFIKYPNIKNIIVPCNWMEQMFSPYYEGKVITWPVGIDTNKWNQKIKSSNQNLDFLIYDKIRWEHDEYEKQLIQPIILNLKTRGLSYDIIKYGNYTHDILLQKLSRCKAIIFLCEHETQGLAYQQILSCNIPILAWDRNGFWQDPFYFPHKIKYQPVSSTPYWDKRCGLKFRNHAEFELKLNEFLELLKMNQFSPRNYIEENLSLEICAQRYLDIYNKVTEELNLQT